MRMQLYYNTPCITVLYYYYYYSIVQLYYTIPQLYYTPITVLLYPFHTSNFHSCTYLLTHKQFSFNFLGQSIRDTQTGS